MTYNNYSISSGKGKLYLKSKEAKDGYEKVTYGTDNKVTYHKYVDSITGTLKYLDVKELDYQGKKLSFLEVTFIDGDDSNKISVPLKNTKSNYTDEVKALVSALNTAEINEVYTLTPKKTVNVGKNGKEYTNISIYLNYVNRKGDNGKGLSTGYIAFEDIPKPEKEDDEDLGVTWNWKPVNKFYAQRLKEIQARFPSNNQQTANSNDIPEQTQTKPKATVEVKEPAPKKFEAPLAEEEDDDLPF